MPSAGSRPAGASDSRRPSAGRQTSRSPGRAVRRIVYSDASQQQHLPPVPHGLPKKGFQPAVTRTAKIESIVSAVAAGEAVSLLPYSNLDVFRHENVAVIPLQEPVAADVVLACLSPKKLPLCGRTLWKYFSA
ncbi:hypothetical protein DW841_08010 [Hungatella hathewayi]|nr:hypothetical protein DW841_08010 [Hungatella hathewayi]